ncbi:PAS domain-containing sensor histidine kinase [Halobacteria archaeon HArc-gm2]|nr:PAS domain-containing sensor histidine kinase [Halobacteria archaeon HArc-gm2]
MQKAPLVVYHGPDATAVTERWDQQGRPFNLRGLSAADDVLDALTEDDVDCLVCAGGEDVLALVDDAQASVSGLLVVVFGREDLDAATALEHGAAHFVDIGENDPVETLEALRSVVDEHHTQRRDRTMLDSLLEHIPLSVYFKDRDSRHVKVSDAMPSMNGRPYIENPDGARYHTPEDVVSLTDFDLYPPELAESATADDQRVIESEDPVVDQVEHTYGSAFDGTYVATSKAPWYDDRGNVVGLVGITRDISERKQYEHQLERQNERLERFAGVISHDLRNPLEVAQGHLRLAREDGDPEHFDVIERSLDRMDDLVEDVLRLARQGGTVTEPDAVAVATAARDAWDVVDSGDATLVVDSDLVVMADPSRLAQLFENLFRNALEHAADRPDALTITVADLRDARGFLVADDGVGIPEDERDTVFDAGFSTADDGTGLGLSIVRTIADAHGWQVTVTESDGGGACFQFGNVHTPES